MAIETVRAFFKEQGLGGRIHEFDSSSATVDWPLKRWAQSPRGLQKPSPFPMGIPAF